MQGIHTVVESIVVCPGCNGVVHQLFDCGDSSFTIDHRCGFHFDSQKDEQDFYLSAPLDPEMFTLEQQEYIFNPQSEEMNPVMEKSIRDRLLKAKLRRAAAHLQGSDTSYFSRPGDRDAINLLYRLADQFNK
jgi:hypothetical protein